MAEGLDPQWWSKAPCRGADTNDVFFPEGQNVDYKPAKAYCAKCPFRDAECLVAALALVEQHGFQANRSAQERKQLRRHLAKNGELYQFLGDPEQGRSIKHGETGWRSGCRCQVCRQANTKAISEARDKYAKAPKGKWDHGNLNTYFNKGCRCDLCRYARTLEMRDRRTNKRKGGSVDKTGSG